MKRSQITKCKILLIIHWLSDKIVIKYINRDKHKKSARRIKTNLDFSSNDKSSHSYIENASYNNPDDEIELADNEKLRSSPYPTNLQKDDNNQNNELLNKRKIILLSSDYSDTEESLDHNQGAKVKIKPISSKNITSGLTYPSAKGLKLEQSKDSNNDNNELVEMKNIANEENNQIVKDQRSSKDLATFYPQSSNEDAKINDLQLMPSNIDFKGKLSENTRYTNNKTNNETVKSQEYIHTGPFLQKNALLTVTNDRNAVKIAPKVNEFVKSSVEWSSQPTIPNLIQSNSQEIKSIQEKSNIPSTIENNQTKNKDSELYRVKPQDLEADLNNEDEEANEC